MIGEVMARKYDPVLLSKFKNFKEAHAATGISKSSYFEIKRKRPDLPWPVNKKGKPARFTAEQIIQFANAKEACAALKICRDTYQKAKKNNPQLPWPKTTRHKFDAAELAGYASVYDAMRKTGIKYNNYYKYRKKFPNFNWPKKQRKYDINQVVSFKSSKEANQKIGISSRRYHELKRTNKDLNWPKNKKELYLESLKKYNQKDLLKYKNCSEAVRQAGITRHIYEKLVKENKKINLISNEIILEKWKKELKNRPRHPLSGLLLLVNPIT
jgi:hypothetical protein